MKDAKALTAGVARGMARRAGRALSAIGTTENADRGSVAATQFDHAHAYREHLDRLLQDNDEDSAMQLAIGGNWQAVGQLERDLVVYAGLKPDQSLVDVGCGSGRLAVRLTGYLTGSYLGTDIVPELLSYARRIVTRLDWRFEHITGLSLPAGDDSTDMAVFFSVFTHLLHEETFVYLREARRVVKPGGTVLFSFLEFASPNHWGVFDAMISTIGQPRHYNQFMSRDQIERFAEQLGYEIVEVRGGMDPFIPLTDAVQFDDGRVAEGLGAFGQSVCILRA